MRGVLAAVNLAPIGVALVALIALVSCAPEPGPPERRLIEPPAPVVEEVSADPSVSVPSAAPEVTVAHDYTSASSITVVVTKRRPLSPLSYVPAELVTLSGVPGGADQQMQAEAADAMTEMSAAATEAGVPFRINTAYRDFEFQQYLYQREVRESGVATADRLVARPGHSEHQTGLAADLYDTPANLLRASFGASGAGTWIREHAHEYGFIVSYPDGAQAVTGYVYEPWHVRYVGKEVAMDMHESGVATLQEYFGVEASPDHG
ncbi:M15 family metallopeptidase [Demequina sp. TTPB684]|uniref:M15 family metallopeptidase n=1 Tax=unclassified Demequina TaxID=2620311 RepID=UPI001CF30037|nr:MULTISPECIES: M15 family metallopeptidase [unclassified Demequina]MCB2412169.1 M15 family metallopeptidase [Demequina sp. TTPB684]UPU89639.1 M15 family metallopeptidase [Demequina sp. TMPB413]